jgi:hypothetical protein
MYISTAKRARSLHTVARAAGVVIRRGEGRNVLGELIALAHDWCIREALKV